MGDQWRIKQLEIENFRGVRGHLSLSLEPGINVLWGANGAGKTTVCHSIEWVLFGKVSAFAGDEFKAEDAIANRLALESAVSTVRLALVRNDETATITRTRPRGKSSTTGSSVVTVTTNSQNYQRKEADVWIADFLAIEGSGFAAGMYLRQDTVSALVYGDEALRSAAIDKLLGLGKVRDLLQNLNLGPLDREFRILQGAENTQREAVVEAAAMRHVQLDKRRTELISQGIPERVLTDDGATDMLIHVADDLRHAAEEYGIDVPLLSSTDGKLADLTALRTTLLALREAATSAAVREDVELQARAVRLKELRTTLERVKRAAGDMTTVDVESLRKELAELEERKRVAAETTNSLRRTWDSAGPVIEQLQLAMKAAEGLNSRILSTQADNLGEARVGIQTQLDIIRSSLQQQSALGRLLAAAQDQLSSHPSNECPVCNQSIDSAQILVHIEQSIAVGGGESLKLTQQSTGLQEQLQTLEARMQSLSQDESSLANMKIGIERMLNQLRELRLDVGRGDSASLSSLLADIGAHHAQASKAVADLEGQYVSLQAQMAGAARVRAELENTLDETRKLLLVAQVPDDIEDAIDTGLEVTAQKQSTNNSRRAILEAVEKTLTTAGVVLSYLQAVREAEHLHTDVAPVQRRLVQLAAAQQRLVALRTSVLEVYNALTLAQEEVLASNLTDLMPGVQPLFTQLGAHPEYAALVIEAEADAKTGANVYRIRAATQQGEDTFVRTIFSRAESNIVALALFLTVSSGSVSQVATTILDDPSQSLDATRAVELANVLLTTAKQRQVIVATEDPFLATRLRESNETHFLELVHVSGQGTMLQDQAARIPV